MLSTARPNARISFQPLPPRPRMLAGAELSRIFGGCAQSGQCVFDSDCCPHYPCTAGTMDPQHKECAFGGSGADGAL